jgi:O-antigen ligase
MTWPHVHNILVWATVATLGVVGGTSLVTHPRLARDLLAVPILAFMLAAQPQRLFVVWLFASPFVQGAANGSSFGHAFYKLIFLVPPLILLARMVMGAAQIRGLRPIDALPGLYLGYIVARVYLAPSTFSSAEASTLRSMYIVVGVGILAYYFAAFGRWSRDFPEMVARALLWSGVGVAVLGIIDGAIHWNIWHNRIYGDTVYRALGPFQSPEALGAYIGAGVAFAVAILVWNGPRSLKRPSILLIALSAPALYLGYTRGPILAVAAVGVVIALIGNRARWPSLLALAAVGTLVFVTWGPLTSSSIYKDRLGVTGTVTPRVVLAHVSFELFRERPAFGWGYATFDQAKLTVPTSDPLVVAATTSHDTFLTVLAELGVTGLLLLVLPWVAISWRTVAAGWRGLIEPWIVGGCVGVAAVFVIGAVTYDARFFPLITALPWIALGLAKNVLASREEGAHSA